MTRFFVGFFLSESPGGHVIYRRNERVAGNATTGRQADVWLPFPSPSVCTDGRSYADVITKFSRIDRLSNFLSYGAPLWFDLAPRALIYFWYLKGGRSFRTGCLFPFSETTQCSKQNFKTESVYPWPFIHCLYFIYARKVYTRLFCTLQIKVLSNNKSTWLSHKLKPSVQSEVTDYTGHTDCS